jgi:site-specific recombinase XerD
MLLRMTSVALVLPSPGDLAALVERAKEYAADARASSTRRAYESDFRAFERWCTAQGLVARPAPPSVVAVYLTHLADSGRKVATLERALTGIVHAHRSHGFDWPRAHPAIANVMGGIRRRLGTAPAQKTPVVDELLAAMLATLDEDLRGLRDRALLTLGWSGAFRRSELVALTVADVARSSEGLIVTLRRSKGDQEGKGAQKGIPYASRAALCPVRSLDAWLASAGITEGPIFRYIDRHGGIHGEALGDRSVARIVQRTAAAAGLDASTVAGHSLRAGFATTAAKRGKSLDAIMRQTLHKSERVARSYIRHAKLFDDNAATGLL